MRAQAELWEKQMAKIRMKCLRNRTDCKPISQFLSPGAATYVCCGLNDGTTRKHEQDVFTHCWKTAETDEISHMDTQDMTQTVAVLSMGLAEYYAKQ